MARSRAVTPRIASLFRGTGTRDTSRIFTGTSKLPQQTSPKRTARTTDQKEFGNWLKQLQEQSPELYTVYEKEGYDALTKAIASQTKQHQNIHTKLKPYKGDEGYDISSALSDKTVTRNDLTLVGFKDTDISDAIATNKRISLQQDILSKLNTYKAKGGYNLAKALADKAITADELKAAGFEEAGIADAVRAAPLAPFIKDGTVDIEGMAQELGNDKASSLLWDAGIYITSRVLEIMQPKPKPRRIKGPGARRARIRDTRDTALALEATYNTFDINDWVVLEMLSGAEFGPAYASIRRAIYKINAQKYRAASKEEQKAILRAKRTYEQMVEGIVKDLAPELRGWYNEQKAEYDRIISACDAKYKAKLQKLKDWHERNPDDGNYHEDRLRLERSIYPDWSPKGSYATIKLAERAAKYAAAYRGAKAAGLDLTSEQLRRLYASTPTSAKNYAKRLGITLPQLAAVRGVKPEALGWKPGVGTVITLTGSEIPRNLRMASTEKQKALGISKVNGVWTQNVVVLANDQRMPTASLDSLSAEKQKAALGTTGYETYSKGTLIGAGAGIIGVAPVMTGQQIVTIGITDAELKEIEDAKAKGLCVGAMATYYTAKTYKVMLKGGSVILVEALSDKSAGQKAKDAGYDVSRVSRRFDWETVGLPLTQEVSATLKGQKLEDFETNLYQQGGQYLISAWESGGTLEEKVNNYNKAVQEYNEVIGTAQSWQRLLTEGQGPLALMVEGTPSVATRTTAQFTLPELPSGLPSGISRDVSDKSSLAYYLSDGFADRYATVIQPVSVSNEDYEKIRPFIKPSGFDSAAAYRAGENNPILAADIIRVTNEFTLATLGDETKAKIGSGEWTLLPYGQVIDTKTLESMPPTYRNLVQNSGLWGYEAYQEKVLEWNKTQGWAQNTIDAIGANAVRLGQDIKNFALLELTAIYPEVKEGDTKPLIDPSIPMAVNVGYIGFTTPIVSTYTAEEAAEINKKRADAQKYYKDMYDAAEMAAQEWHASRPYLQPVYPEGFVDSVKKDSSALKDPLLWGETIANTLPYTVATGLIVAGAIGAGPAGVAATAPLAFAITMSVEGHDIYKDAIANGATHDRALELANTYGAISAAIETLGDTIFVGALGFAGGAFSQSLGRNLGGNIVRGAAKKYGWKTLTTGMIKDFVNQGGQEFFQEVVHNAAIKTVNENQALLENTANAFVSGVIGTAPFVLFPAGGQAIRMGKSKLGDVRITKGTGSPLTPIDITPQMQLKILDKVFAPVSGFTVKTTEAEIEHLKRFAPEMLEGGPVEYLTRLWEGKGRNVYEAGKGITVGLIDKKTVVTGKAQVDEVALAYNEMHSKVNEYAYTQLKLKQALKAISDFGLAKSKSQLKTLNEYKKRAKELEAKLRELKGPMVEAVKKFSDTFLKNSVGLEAEQKAEVREMAKTIVTDIDSVTTQLFGDRDAREIAKDIKELEGQIKVIEEEISKGVTRGQLEGYGRLVSILKGQVGDLVNELRMRYLAEGEKIKPDTKRLTMDVMSLQARLIKAVDNLNNFSGSALNYDVYRKGELATKGGVVKLERDTFEAVQRTTEAIWGRESYAEVLEKLNRTLGDIIESMESLRAKKAATKAAFKIYDAIKKQDVKLLKEGVRLLQLEAGKVKDKPLLLQQVKLLETLTMENFWDRFKETKPKKKEDFTWYKSSEFESEQEDLIRRDAERNVALRLGRLMDKLPEYMRRWSSNQVMDYLRKTYDKQYFQDVHFGEFEDLDDFLDVDKEEARIRQEIARQEEIQQRQRDLEIAKRERDLAKDLRDRASKPKWRGILDEHIEQRDRDVAQKERVLKTATKTKLVIPAAKPIDITKTQEERGVAITAAEKEASAAEKAKSEAKAAQRIRIAKKQIMKEGEGIDKKETQNESAFPGIRPKTAKDRGRERERISHALDDYLRTMTLAQAIKLYEEEAGDQQGVFTDAAVQNAIEAGIYAYAKAKTRALTQTQTRTAVQTAVGTALQQSTKTETAQELKFNTRTITELVTKTATRKPPIMYPPRLKVEPVKGKQKKVRTGPALASLKQGLFYISWFPPFRGNRTDVVYSRTRPHWAATAKGRGSPQKTLRVFGKVPPLMELPMGIVTARVKHGRHLSFSRSRRVRRRKKVV